MSLVGVLQCESELIRLRIVTICTPQYYNVELGKYVDYISSMFII